jgi:glucose-6-phosphate dehydrogenase assembly protein OpcA
VSLVPGSGRMAARPLGGAKVVHLSEAEGELRTSWAAIDEELRREVGEGMLRLRQTNLVVVTDRRWLAQAREAAALATRGHPGRVVVLAPGRVDAPASIATACTVDQDSGRHVCSEEIVIEGANGQVGQIRAAVLQLLVPNLPVIGWAAQPVGADIGVLEWLAGISDQLVIDLAKEDSAASVMAVLEGLSAAPKAPSVREFEWLRILPWRLMTAELFERPERRLMIPSIAEVQIRHRDAPVQAVLYGGWFMARSGRDSDTLAVSISEDIEQDAEHEYRGLTGVRVEFAPDASSDGLEFGECVGRSVSIRRRPKALVGYCSAPQLSEDVAVQTMESGEQGEADLLSQAIDMRSAGAGYEDALKIGIGLLGDGVS